MKRDISQLSGNVFDILVIGGGIHGATTFWEASRRGLKAALIEQGDFGNATSSNSLKIIHGGFRYLQHADLRRIRESIYSRKIMMRVAPHLVQPLPCAIPTNRSFLRNKIILQAALKLNDIIGFDRNKGIEHSQKIPSGRIISGKKLFEFFPWLRKTKFTGAAIWYDCIAVNTERLIVEFIFQASDLDGIAANYVQARQYLLENEVVTGVLAQDTMTQEQFKIQAKFVINAVGPWLNEMFNLIPSSSLPRTRWTKAVNIVVRKPLVKDMALGLESKQEYFDKDAVIQKGKRFLFFVPWRGYTLIGTTYKLYEGPVKYCSIEKEDIIELLDEVNAIFPGVNLSVKDVSFYHYGLLPVAYDAGNLQPKTHSEIYDHERIHGLKGLISINGVKYTTAPIVAKKVIDHVLGKKFSDEKNLFQYNNVHPASNFQSIETVDDFGEPEIARHVKESFGERSSHIFALWNEETGLRELVSKTPPITRAEIVYVLREEMALKLGDVIFRRTDLGTAECPSREVLKEVANLMAEEFGWNNHRIQSEIEEVLSVYKGVINEQNFMES